MELRSCAVLTWGSVECGALVECVVELRTVFSVLPLRPSYDKKGPIYLHWLHTSIFVDHAIWYHLLVELLDWADEGSLKIRIKTDEKMLVGQISTVVFEVSGPNCREDSSDEKVSSSSSSKIGQGSLNGSIGSSQYSGSLRAMAGLSTERREISVWSWGPWSLRLEYEIGRNKASIFPWIVVY